MEHNLFLYNSLKRTKQLFKPLHEGHVGMMYAMSSLRRCPSRTCPPCNHVRHSVPLSRHLGYKVRYVRNITDVGHLEHDADSGEDKIAKKARLEQLVPMEVVQLYLNRYHHDMEALNVLPPSIEPHASGHNRTDRICQENS